MKKKVYNYDTDYSTNRCRVIDILVSGPDGDEPVVYFYCNRNDPMRNDPTSVLTAILKQLSIAFPGLPSTVVTEFETRELGGRAQGSLDFEECREIIMTLLKIYPQTTIIIDALDECEIGQRWKLLDALSAMVQSNDLVKIFVSSRNESDINRKFMQVPYVHINSVDTSADIDRFVLRNVTDGIKNGLFYVGITEDLKEDIISTIAGQATGM